MPNNHSAYYELVKSKRESGTWNEAMLRVLVRAGRITENEFTEITGIDF